jgi:RimJ/RimL family protein N-acetyltransferase
MTAPSTMANSSSTTSRIRLRHVQPDDYPALHAMETDPTTSHTWRYRGQLPPLEEYEAALWQQTTAVLVVENIDDGSLAGYLHLHDVDWRAGHGYFSLYAGPHVRGRGTVMEGLMLFCDWVFGNYDLRWIYAHAFEHNIGQFSSGLRRGEAVHLGTLRDRVEVLGEPTDVHVIGIERENWLNSPLRARLHRLQDRGRTT